MPVATKGSDRVTDTKSDPDKGGGATYGRGPCSLPGILCAPSVLRLACSFFHVKLLRYTMLLWLPYYHVSTLKHDDTFAASLSTAFEIGGALGAMILGFVSDRLGSQLGGQGRARIHLSAVALFASSFLFLAYPSIVKSSPAAGYMFMILIGVGVEGPESAMSSSMLADLSETLGMSGSELARLSGIVNGIGTAGAACTGPLQLLVAGSRNSDHALFAALAVVATFAAAALEVRVPVSWATLAKMVLHACPRSLEQSEQGDIKESMQTESSATEFTNETSFATLSVQLAPRKEARARATGARSESTI